jgi:hypothetical protein
MASKIGCTRASALSVPAASTNSVPARAAASGADVLSARQTMATSQAGTGAPSALKRTPGIAWRSAADEGSNAMPPPEVTVSNSSPTVWSPVSTRAGAAPVRQHSATIASWKAGLTSPASSMIAVRRT